MEKNWELEAANSFLEIFLFWPFWFFSSKKKMFRPVAVDMLNDQNPTSALHYKVMQLPLKSKMQ